MLSLTLVENRSTPAVFAVHICHERRGDKVQRIEKRYQARGGRWVCVGSKVVPYTANKDWTGLKSGEKGSHGRPFTVKRDWIMLHTQLEMERLYA